MRNESDDLYVSPVVGSEQVDPSESATGDNTEDPLDAGYSPPEREPNIWRGETEAETERGESLDERLAEEQPDVGEQDVLAADADQRAGRLVAPDEGVRESHDDEIATDVGRDGQASSAEEAAVHEEQG